jgi:hypothetical protein
MSNRNGAWNHDKSAIRVAGKCSNALCNFGSIAHAGRCQPNAERWCGSLNRAQICSPCRIGRIKNHRNSVNTGRAFLKQLQPLLRRHCEVSLQDHRLPNWLRHRFSLSNFDHFEVGSERGYRPNHRCTDLPPENTVDPPPVE